MKRWLIVLIVSMVLIVGMTVPTVVAGEVTSTPSSWALEEIQKAKEYNLVTERVLTGYQQGISREDFCELVVKLYEALSGIIAKTPEMNPFTDTDNPEVLKANQLGIVGGVGGGRFAPSNHITRQEIAVMLHRAIAAANSEMIDGKYEITFADKEEIASWAQEAVGFMNQKGILGGVGGNRVSPGGNTTREQAIALVKRTFENFKDVGIYQPLVLDGAARVIHIPQDHSKIQAGINAARDGDALLVAPGTYYENIDFRGKNIIVTSEKGPEETVINGGFEGSVVTFQSGEDREAVLHGFTIMNGMAGLSRTEQKPELYPNGGGISIYSVNNITLLVILRAMPEEFYLYRSFASLRMTR